MAQGNQSQPFSLNAFWPYIWFWMITGVWILTVTAPLLAAFGLSKLSFLNYFVFHLACHQNPNRSFWVCGYPMAVCARCSGIYTGVFSGWLLCRFRLRFRNLIEKSLTRTKLVVCFAPLLADVVLHTFFEVPDWSLIRAATGFVAGCAVSSFVSVRLLATQPSLLEN